MDGSLQSFAGALVTLLGSSAHFPSSILEFFSGFVLKPGRCQASEKNTRTRSRSENRRTSFLRSLLLSPKCLVMTAMGYILRIHPVMNGVTFQGH